MFLGADGKPDPAKSRDSALGIGVPGTVAGLALALEKYGSGKFTLAEIVQPAIALARDGFVVADDIADTLPRVLAALRAGRHSAKIFLKADGTSAARGRPPGADRSRRHARRDRRAGAARISTKARSRQSSSRRDARCRRHHDAGGSEGLSASDPRAGARHLSRLRHRLDAAAVVRRHGADRNR